MEAEILDSLEDLGTYSGNVNDEKSLDKAVNGSEAGPRNTDFTHLVAWVTEELRVLCKLEEQVNPTAGSDEHSSFLMELSSFLKELGCPLQSLMDGPVNERLSKNGDRLLLLRYLLCELEAARMVSSAKPDEGLKVEMKESDEAKDLKLLLTTLLFPKPPNNIGPKQLFSKVGDKVSDVMSKAHHSLLNQPLFTGVLTDKQWVQLGQMQEEMNAEYRQRRRVFIKRCDVTIQSFQWSDRAKTREDDLSREFRSRRDKMVEEPEVTVGHMLAAREDLALMEKTSSASVRKNTKTNLHKIIIGRVPDRGGRAFEQEPPPPEMPSWQKERSQGGGGRGGGGFSGNRGGRGGSGFSSDRVQGQWNNQGGGGGRYQDNQRGGYQESQRGGYQNNRGYNDNRPQEKSYHDNRDNRGYRDERGGYDGRAYGGGGGRGRGRGRGYANRY